MHLVNRLVYKLTNRENKLINSVHAHCGLVAEYQTCNIGCGFEVNPVHCKQPDILCAELNSASCPLWDCKRLVAHRVWGQHVENLVWTTVASGKSACCTVGPLSLPVSKDDGWWTMVHKPPW